MDGKSESASQRKIEFPEIETVKDDKEAGQKNRTGLGKKRFTSIAVKVMSQLYQDKTKTIEEETNTDTVQQPVDETVKKNQPAKAAPTRKISRVGNKNKFASLVRLAKYKKMASRPISETSEDDAKPEEIPMPQKPRFSATLSPEAQYAMLKGYEDLLLNNLKEKNKQEKESLIRVKTPHHKVASLHLNGFEQARIAEEQEEEEEEVVSEHTRRKAWDIRPAPYYGQLYRLDSKDHMNKSMSRRDSKALLPRKMSSLQIEDGEKSIPKDKQLLLTHRFHCAMDILDTMKESQGVMVTSPRFKQRVIQPANNYNAWSREWSREFKLEYR